ncbi:hypothetical protein TSUD_208860 [Trifolium subterraneum]|uniref:RRM domain-containing protein n=1 Tax=Trifolium subterraneum TaxID=3900 RepID=A0A2Z6MKL8_TRISU|nr:hypothetical protein TSUD_208860 [Trifolium subterraneum]
MVVVSVSIVVEKKYYCGKDYAGYGFIGCWVQLDCVRAQTEKRKGYIQKLDKETTSFFISNLPDDATTEDLWMLFLRYGRVVEVYIPKKLDKRGGRFGFVKFKEIKEVEALTVSMKEVWLGSFKLRVNLARFGRAEIKEGYLVSKPGLVSTAPVVLPSSGVSFKAALVGARYGGSSSDEEMTFMVPANKVFLTELKGSLVGTLAYEQDVTRIQTTIHMEGFQSVRVSHMGDNMVLLRSPVEGDVDRLLRSRKECLDYYFSNLSPWAPGLFAKQREVWVQIFGIPLHIWGEDFFKMVGAKMGEFLDFDAETASMARFDVARLKIRTSTWALLDVIFNVVVGEECFRISVKEERGSKQVVGEVWGEVEDEGSRVVPLEECGDGDDCPGDGENFSGEDDVSEEGIDGDLAVKGQRGGRYEVEGARLKEDQDTKGGGGGLTLDKSTESVDSKKETNPLASTFVGNEVKVCKHVGVKSGVAEDLSRDEGGLSLSGGTDLFFEKDKVEEDRGGIKMLPCHQIEEVVGQELDTVQEDEVGLGLHNQVVLGPFEQDGFQRYSSVSEPEEVFLSSRTKLKKTQGKLKKQKPVPKFRYLGVPTCVQLAEAAKGGGGFQVSSPSSKGRGSLRSGSSPQKDGFRRRRCQSCFPGCWR